MYSFQSSVDWRNIQGWDQVDKLTDHLLTFVNLSLSYEEVMTTLLLYKNLDKFDKGRTIFPPRYQQRLLTGRFKVSKQKSSVVPGVDSTKR